MSGNFSQEIRPPAGQRTSPSGSRIARSMSGAGVYVIVVLLAAVGALVSREFLTVGNLLNTLRAVGLLGIVAVGVAFVTYSGHYADLSVPVTMAFSGIIAVSSLKFGIFGSLLAGMLAGLAVGVVNGLAIGHLRVNPIIWTLAAASCMDGFMRWAYSGKQVYPDASTPAGQVFLSLYGADLPGGIPCIIVILTVLVLAGYILMSKTTYGAQLKLTGSAYRVARLSGVDVRRVVALAFLISSLTASIGGILLTSLNKVGAPYIGGGYDFLSVTAVVVGGMSLAGGRGSIFGTLGGVLVIGLMRNIMTLLAVGTFTQDILQGLVFILVVGLNSYSLRRAGRDDA